MTGPLSDVRVLEFGEIIAVPFATMLLADMGADVIKVEPVWGEAWRHVQQLIPDESRHYIAINRGKRSLPLDLRRPEAREIVYNLLDATDVVVVNYRPDVPKKLGIDYETLAAKNSRLIYCENTAFGSMGPQSHLPGYDIIVQAISGLMASEAKAVEGVPQHVFTPVVDVSAGLSMAWAVCAALYVRERTGLGQKVEASLLATALGMQLARFLRIDSVDREPQRSLLKELARLQEQGSSYEVLEACYQDYHAPPPPSIYYRTYRTSDGFLAVGCLSDPLRQKLLAVLGLHDIRFEADYRRDSPEALEFGLELAAKAEGLFQGHTTRHWLAVLGGSGIPAAPLRFTEELLDDEQVIANELVVDLEHQLVGKVRMAGPLVKMSETPLCAATSSPALGQHTDEILGALGYGPEDIQRLRDAGVTR